MPRIDRAARQVRASPGTVWAAFVDAASVAAWLPPAGMTARIDAFEPRPGGAYCLTLTYRGTDHPRGKSAAAEDRVRGTFVLLEPQRRIVQRVTFEAEDPAFAGAMTVTWTLDPDPQGTTVTVAATDVPPGIAPEDHAAGLASTLANLAAFCERAGR
jgi:uncharacterized protein YndB with AHSA1/START domain